MISGKTLHEYARLVLKVGVNLQQGQGLEIACPVEKSEVAEAFCEEAYKAGAKIVQVRWQSENIDKINYLNADINALTNIQAVCALLLKSHLPFCQGQFRKALQ